jgi:L-alanine-DL-glutamate epimerase-like enolase superfamily enzyme
MESGVKIAGGEGCNSYHQAVHMIKHGKLDFIQIDVGRIGGITPADKLCKLAASSKSCHYVNHTYKSHIQLAASLHVFAGVEKFNLLESIFSANRQKVA